MTLSAGFMFDTKTGGLRCVLYNAMGAVRETFNRTTGMLGLFNAQGKEVASLKFAGTGDLYAAPTTGLATNYIAITHSAAGSLSHTFSA